MPFDSKDYLARLSDVPDSDIDLGKAALALASRDQPGVVMDRYVHHLEKIAKDVGTQYSALLEAGAEDNVGTRLASLKHAIVNVHGYKGDIETYNDLQNANLMRVIDRRKGLPVTLAILYIGAARAQGWRDVNGLDFPGHFVCRIERDGKRMIFDPFYDCKVLEAYDLRNFVKQVRGENAELSADFFKIASNRDILMRLQNNIKYRQIESEDYKGALKTVEGMRLVDRNEYRLLLDAGVLYARTGQPEAAIKALEDYIAKTPHSADRHEAAILLQDIKSALPANLS